MIHDELVWEVRPAELARAASVVQEVLQDTRRFPVLGGGAQFEVSLPVKVTCGPSLGGLGPVSM